MTIAIGRYVVDHGPLIVPNVVLAIVRGMLKVNRLTAQANNFIIFSVKYMIKLIESHKSIVVDKCHILAFGAELVKVLISEKSFDWKIVVRV